MSEPVPAGTWVRIRAVVLDPGERAAHVPPDTRAVPLEMTVKGFLAAPASPGQEADIQTPAGRRLRGTLDAVLPAYEHRFGPPIPELVPIGRELRARLAAGGGQGGGGGRGPGPAGSGSSDDEPAMGAPRSGPR